MKHEIKMSYTNGSTFHSNNPIVMSSREIAEITGKRHDHVLRDIRKMYDALGEEGSPQLWVHPQNGQKYTVYLLDEDHLMTLVTGYDINMRHAIMKRWKALEKGEAKPYHEQITFGKECELSLNRRLRALNGYKNFFKSLGYDSNQAALNALSVLKKRLGDEAVEDFAHVMVPIEAPIQAETLTATDLAERLSLNSGRQANKLLEDAGFQVRGRDHKDRLHWTPTEAGQKYARLVDTSKAHTNGTVQQWRWYPEVVDVLKGRVK